MFRRFVRALAFVSATGCVSAPPAGPLVEYRDGITPITRPVKCPATYVLRHSNAPGAASLAEHHVVEGERIGFRREEDGSVVAVAPGYTLALPAGAYAWEVVPASVPPWRERVRRQLHEDTVATARATKYALLTAGLLTLMLGCGLVYAYAQSNPRLP